jgi:GT2 family glycosyltransferase
LDSYGNNNNSISGIGVATIALSLKYNYLKARLLCRVETQLIGYFLRRVISLHEAMSYFPSVSVIIVNFNNKKFLEKCLGSVFRSEYPNLEVVFVDNASTDGSVDFVKERFGRTSSLKIVQNSKNLGFAEGNTSGMKLASSQYFVLLNNDTEVDKNWLLELIRVMESDHSIGAAQCKLISMNLRKQMDSAGGFIDRFGFPLERGEHEEDRGQYDNQDEIFYAKGAGFAVRRCLLDEIGSFDKDYFLYYEETDLCWRIWLRGYRIVFAHKSVVYHQGFASIFDTETRRKLTYAYLGTKNQIMTLLKNYELSNLVKYVPAVIFLKTLFDFATFRSDRFMRVRGILYVIRNLDKIWIKRKNIQVRIRRKRDMVLFERKLFISFSLKRIRTQKDAKSRRI